MAHEPFLTAGRKTDSIDVKISYKIIHLFSEGLYSSSNKAIEELVSNAFDAGATRVHVILSADLQADDATIVVIDDGEGMDKHGFEQHWLIGSSNKRASDYASPKGRKQIGKFGIGKLATYVLANQFTHVTKKNNKYYAITMNYKLVPEGDDGEIMVEDPVSLDLRELTEVEAKEAVSRWIKGTKPGFAELKLFGRGSAKSWTVAILSNLKGMATEIRRGRLKWVLSSAMPLRDDFMLFLDGDPVIPSKMKQKKVGQWILGKDLIQLPTPAPDDGEVSIDGSVGRNELSHFGITYPNLGRVSGYVEVYKDPIDEGKSEDLERSNGFFVYVRGRLVNIEDSGFGIDRNKLRHGTFSRFRLVLHADGLDDELRSSREAVRFGPLFNIARNIVHGAFNYARTKLDEDESRDGRGSQLARRFAASPAAFTRHPIAALVEAAFKGTYTPRYISFPRDLAEKDQGAFVESLRDQSENGQALVQDSTLADNLSQDQPIAVFDVRTGRLQINILHPFVAYFLDEYEDKQRSVPLELLAMSEVMIEAQLLQLGYDLSRIRDFLDHRDALLRHLARSTGKRNARMVAQALMDAANDKAVLESELVAAFDSMGFDAIPLGGPKRADGRAEASLSPKDGKPQSYAVSLEAKSKEKPGTKVTAKTVGISTIARHRKEAKCDHAIVVGPDFPTTKGDSTALAKEIAEDRANTHKSITLIRINDLARLVRLVPLKRVNFNKLRELFETCSMPEESKAWIDKIAVEKREHPPYKEILEIIKEEQQAQQDELVEFGAIRSGLRRSREIEMSTEDLKEACKALARWVPEWVTVYNDSVEIHMRPDKILAAVSAAISEYPENERQ